MNWSLLTADRATHTKIVALAVAAAVLIALGSIYNHQRNVSTATLSGEPAQIAAVTC